MFLMLYKETFVEKTFEVKILEDPLENKYR